MESELLIQPHSTGRSKVCLKILLSDEENSQLERKLAPRHVDSQSPIPCQFYQNVDPAIKTIQGVAEFEGKIYKCYFLSSARRVLLNRPIVGRTHIRLPLNGILNLGYINKTDAEKFGKWWEKTQGEIKEFLTQSLYNATNKTQGFEPLAPMVIAKDSSNLNPISPEEAKGLRRRALEDF